MITIYGISNCDMVRKARRWLEAHGVNHAFHDVRRQGIDVDKLNAWEAMVGWEILLNRRGTTWRTLPDEQKKNLDKQQAIRLMREHPAMIRRPVLEYDGRLIVGYSEARYAELFQTAL